MQVGQDSSRLSHNETINPAILGNTLAELSANSEFSSTLDKYAIENIVELKISRFLDQLGTYYPENVYELIMNKVEKPLIAQILKRVGGNQVHASRILGINRNTLRKKMKLYGL